MNTRIRYRKTSEATVLESVQRFVPESNNGHRYYVRLNTSTLEFWVIDDAGDTIEVTGRANDLHRVKIAAKKSLQELGVSFSDKETRSKSTRKSTKSAQRTVVL